MQNTIKSIFLWFLKAVPVPANQNKMTQTGVHFEEVGEMLDEMVGEDATTSILIDRANASIKALADRLKSGNGTYAIKDRKLFCDALCDQVVTAVGTGRMQGMDMPGAVEATDASNWSKFVDGEPIFNENKKIMKGPSYKPVELEPFIHFNE